jgi:uncharacterized protein YgbK (DUF1537 family)
MEDKLLISFYGDDFTGSTDVMESLSFNGVPTALFLDPPEKHEVENFHLKNNHVSEDGKLMAFGVAGISRSLSPAQMDQELPDVFEELAKIPTKYFHYKVCSTFDSAPHVGNIGHATMLALRYFKSSFIPLVVGAPFLNRFCVFANLFARVEDTTYRIDRHPTMSKHPVTPMHEADLRLHISKQTNLPVHSIDVNHLSKEETANDRYKEFSKSGGYILFDVLTTQHLLRIGNVIDENNISEPQLLVGSSAIEYALCYHWQGTRHITKQLIPSFTKPAERYVIMAGSCSPTTASQIQYGLSIGYEGIRIDSIRLIENPAEEIQRCVSKALGVLSRDKVPMLFTATGPDDACIEVTRKHFVAQKNDKNIGDILGNTQGDILKAILDLTSSVRVTVAGGDTAGFVSRKLGIYALEVLVPIAPGAPLCVAHAKDKRYDGLEICLKGGQNGTERYFEFVQQGKAN